jgi:glucose/arabinose dehydrogenase
MKWMFFTILIITGAFLFTQRQITTEVSPTRPTPIESQREVLAEGLEIPWGVVAADDALLITQRSGSVVKIDEEGKVSEVGKVEEVVHRGEGGLLGITKHPQFEVNRWIYVYYTYLEQAGQTLNRVERYTFQNDTLSQATIVVEAIPGAINHNGGRIKFGPDGFLYVGTGDAQQPSLAQDTSSLAGKILRVTDEGKPAADNRLGTIVYSYGHRNVQGLAWDDQGQLWATEHGPQANDELNLIDNGANYGWPVIRGSETRNGMVSPIIHSGQETWAPSGMAFYKGRIYFAGLRGQALYSYKSGEEGVQRYYHNAYGRLRDVFTDEERVWLLTNNRDGRGQVSKIDDRLIQIEL